MVPYTPRTGRQISRTGDIETGATALYLVPAGKPFFVAGDPNHVASAATVTGEYDAVTAAINTPFHTSLCRPTRARPFAVPLHPHTIPASTTPLMRPAPIATMVQTLPHTPTPLHILCPPASGFLITLWFRPDGTQRNFVCGNLFVRYIIMNFRPNIPQSPPSHAPN